MKAELRVWVARTRSTECSSTVPVLCLSWVGDRNRWGGGVNGGESCPSALCPQLFAGLLLEGLLVGTTAGEAPLPKKSARAGIREGNAMRPELGLLVSYRRSNGTGAGIPSCAPTSANHLYPTDTPQPFLNFFVVLFPPGHQIHNGRM